MSPFFEEEPRDDGGGLLVFRAVVPTSAHLEVEDDRAAGAAVLKFISLNSGMRRAKKRG